MCLILPQHHCNINTTLSRHYHTITTSLEHYRNIIVALPQHCHNITPTLPQHCHNITTTLPQHYLDITTTSSQHYRKLSQRHMTCAQETKMTSVEHFRWVHTKGEDLHITLYRYTYKTVLTLTHQSVVNCKRLTS